MTNGYVYRYEHGHPMAYSNGLVYEHRYVLHEAGIDIPPGSCVHHINGDKTDNRLENLEVVDLGQHTSHHNQQAGVVKNQFGTFPLIRDEADRLERRNLRDRRRRALERERR